MEKMDQLFIIGGVLLIVLILLFLLWAPQDLSGGATKSSSGLSERDAPAASFLMSGSRCLAESSLFPDPRNVPDTHDRVSYTYRKRDGVNEVTISASPDARLEWLPQNKVFRIDNNTIQA